MLYHLTEFTFLPSIAELSLQYLHIDVVWTEAGIDSEPHTVGEFISPVLLMAFLDYPNFEEKDLSFLQCPEICLLRLLTICLTHVSNIMD